MMKACSKLLKAVRGGGAWQRLRAPDHAIEIVIVIVIAKFLLTRSVGTSKTYF